MPGLERFYSNDTNTVVVDGNQDSIKIMLSVTYHIYSLVLRFTLKQFNIYDKEEFKIFKDFSKEL